MGVSASPQNSIVQVCLLNQSGDIECGQFDFDGSYTDIAGWGSAMCALTSAGKIECQLRFSPEDITEENLTEIDRLNNDFNFVALHGGQGLCATTDTAQTVCASAANLPARIGSPLSDRLPLPGIQPDQPGAVDDLSVNVYSDTTAELLWSYIGKGGDGRVTGVQIYRNGALLIEIDQLSSYLDTSLTPGIDYRYQVSIVNSRGDVGPLGNAITINTSNRNNTGEIPTVPNVARANPTGLQALQYGDTVFELVWDRSNLNVIGYEVYRNHVLLGFTNGISFFDDTATDMHIHYDILAIGTDGQILGFGGVSAR